MLRFAIVFLVLFQSCSIAGSKVQSIEGIAADAKRSAVVLTDQNVPYYLEGVSHWDSIIIGKRIVVEGVIEEVVFYPDSSNIQKQEIRSSYKLIKSPEYRLLEE